MRCQHSRGEWHSYVKKALHKEEMAEMALHLAYCAACRQEVAEIKEMARLVEEIRHYPGLPEGITRGVMAGIDTGKYRKEKAKNPPDYKLWGRSLVAAGFILFLVSPFPFAATLTELNEKIGWQMVQPFDKMDMATQAAFGKIRSIQLQNIKQVFNKEEIK